MISFFQPDKESKEKKKKFKNAILRERQREQENISGNLMFLSELR